MCDKFNKMFVRQDTYFKGGSDDRLMSGLWIGDKIQQNTLFINCSFNFPDCVFIDCVFIDCHIIVDETTLTNCKIITVEDDWKISASKLKRT